MFKTFTTAIALSLVAAAAPVSAGNHEDISVTVDTSGLDLASDAGIRMLEQRFATGIRNACGRPKGRGLAELRAVRDCRESFAEPVALAIAEVARNPERLAGKARITVRG